MPAYGKPSGRDTLENILKRLDEMESRVRRLAGSPHRSGFDRGDTASVPDPIEGQTMIQYDDESPHYYSNGQWRNFGGGSSLSFSWCRARMWNNMTDQTIASGNETSMRFNDSQSDDTGGVFTATANNSAFDGITVNADGLYAITARMYWASNACPNSAIISLNGIDWDHWGPYNVGQVDTSTLTAGFAARVARLEATQKVYVTVLHSSGGASKNLYGQGGNFLELVYLGDISVSAISGGP